MSVRPKKKLGKASGAAAAIWLFSCSIAAAAQIFYHRDAEGVYHFTNVPGPESMPLDGASPFLPLGRLSEGSTGETPNGGAYEEIISEYAERFDVERALVKAVIRAESGFDHLAVSNKGACGLMQLMPKTAQRQGVRNVYDPRENIRGGVRHLRTLLDRHGNSLPQALAAYNAGSEPVERYRGIPPYEETRAYVTRVLGFRRQYLKEERE